MSSQELGDDVSE